MSFRAWIDVKKRKRRVDERVGRAALPGRDGDAVDGCRRGGEGNPSLGCCDDVTIMFRLQLFLFMVTCYWGNVRCYGTIMWSTMIPHNAAKFHPRGFLLHSMIGCSLEE